MKCHFKAERKCNQVQCSKLTSYAMLHHIFSPLFHPSPCKLKQNAVKSHIYMGYPGAIFIPAWGSNWGWGYLCFSDDQNNCYSSGVYLLRPELVDKQVKCHIACEDCGCILCLIPLDCKTPNFPNLSPIANDSLSLQINKCEMPHSTGRSWLHFMLDSA